MRKRDIVEFDDGHGGTIAVELPVDVSSEYRKISLGANAEQVAVTFAEAMSGLPQIVDAVRDQVNKAIRDVDEVAIEFGVKLSAKAGVVLASASADATLKLTLRWAREPHPGGSGDDAEGGQAPPAKPGAAEART